MTVNCKCHHVLKVELSSEDLLKHLLTTRAAATGATRGFNQHERLPRQPPGTDRCEWPSAGIRGGFVSNSIHTLSHLQNTPFCDCESSSCEKNPWPEMDAVAVRTPVPAISRTLNLSKISGPRCVKFSPKFCRLVVRAEQTTEGSCSKGGEDGGSLSSSIGSSIVELSRRKLFAAVFSVATVPPLVRKDPALAATNFRQYNDRFDGYSFSYPEGWIQVRGAGADVFFRDPVNLDENVVVEFSSPSSSSYKSVEDLGTPEQAAQKVLGQYLTEFMSTRIGVRRESNVLSTKSRVGDDGRLYYDIEVNVKSFANTNQLAVMPQDRVAKLEWSRRYLSVIGVENNRLYELRLQTPERVLMSEESDLRQMMTSFKLVKLDA